MNLNQKLFTCIAMIHMVNSIGQMGFKLQTKTTVIDHLHINRKVKAILRRSNMTKLKVLGLTNKLGRMHHLHI